MIVLRTPKGWTGPKTVDGLPTEGSWRSHQVPLANVRDKPEHLAQLEEWMRSYRPEELFDEQGTLRADLAALAPQGERRMGANPHANGGLLLRSPRAAGLPRLRRRGPRAGDERRARPRACSAVWLRDVIERQPGSLPRDGPGRDRIQPARRGVRGDRPHVGRGAAATPTITSRPTAA